MSNNLDLIPVQLIQTTGRYITNLLQLSPDKLGNELGLMPTLYQQVNQVFMGRLVRLTLQWANGNQSKAAARLGVTRATLRARIKQYNIAISKKNYNDGVNSRTDDEV